MSTSYSIPRATDYLVASDGTILSYHLEWDGQPEDTQLVAMWDAAISESLWSFVSGSDVRAIYKSIFASVLETGQPIEMAAKCDGAGLVRRTRLKISAGDGESVRVRDIVLSEEQRKDPSKSAEDAQEPVLYVCSWCKRVTVDGDEWSEFDRVWETLLDSTELVYAGCPDCMSAVREQFSEEAS